MEFQAIVELVKSRFPKTEAEFDKNLIIDKNDFFSFVEFIRESPELNCTVLDLLTASDHLSENQIHLIYGFQSYRHKHYLLVKVKLDRQKPVIESLTKWWGIANWTEREVFDLYGVQFEGHPELRRILTPPDFVGHGLRKDYERPGFFVKKPDFK
ncbi:NADH-quinone oxidoreductase subunit C [bacterium]|nr:NADH-quinone oxidoreductase subunit C [bacterium]